MAVISFDLSRFPESASRKINERACALLNRGLAVGVERYLRPNGAPVVRILLREDDESGYGFRARDVCRDTDGTWVVTDQGFRVVAQTRELDKALDSLLKP